MLSSSERQIWDDIERFHAAEAEEPVLPGLGPTRRRRHGTRGLDDLPAAVVAGGWGAILLILFGAVVVGLAIGAATALGWLLWRWLAVAAWPGHHLGSAGEPGHVRSAAAGAARAACRRTAEPAGRRASGTAGAPGRAR